MTELASIQTVSDVPVAKDSLDECSSMQALQMLTGQPFEACSNPGSTVVATPYHPFVAAATTAFSDHRPLILSPDMFWLLVTQGVAHYVRANAQAMRSLFVGHEDRQNIDVRRDDFIKGDASNPWPEVFGEFSDKIRTLIGDDHHGNLVANFSTTSEVERVANEIVLMDTMSHYFDYSVTTMCGIPSVTLEGAPDDWQELCQRVATLGQAYDLAEWTDRLAPLLDRIANNAAGRDDAELWRDFYKNDESSGGPYIDGWMVDFFPFMNTSIYLDEHGNETTGWTEDDYGFKIIENVTHVNVLKPYDADLHNANRGIVTSTFPGSLSRVPFTWNYLELEFDMEFVAGFTGIEQDKKTMSVRPVIGWGVGNDASGPQ